MIQVKISKWLKLLNSLPFIKKTLVYQVYIRISSSWMTFTVLQWMKRNFKIGKFSRFLLRSEYTIQVKIWKWLKLLNSFPFIKKTLANHVYIRIWSSWLVLTVFPWMKTNFKISQFSRFLLRSEYAIHIKIWNWLKLLKFCSIHQEKNCKSSLHSNLIILTDFHSFTVNEDKLENWSIFKITVKVRVCD